MSIHWWRLAAVAFCLAVVAPIALAQSASDLVPYLRTERRDVAHLTSQVQHLQQQNDPLGAAMVASLIPPRQAQIARLEAAVSARGQNPMAVTLSIPAPLLGTREDILAHHLQLQPRIVTAYQQLGGQATAQDSQLLAALGRNVAEQQRLALRMAYGATVATPAALTDGLIAALALERTTIADLQTQSARLRALGDTTGADLLLSFVPARQQQAANLETMVTRMGGNIAQAMPVTPVALPTRAQILAHQQNIGTQLTNSYALMINTLPPSPLRTVMQQGQAYTLTALTQLGQLPAIV